LAANESIQLPQDQYAHAPAANEWWWHIGTLFAGSRRFGFEINAAKRTFNSMAVLFSELMVTDVESQVHYQNSVVFPFTPDWAETDTSKPWRVSLGSPGGNGAVAMAAPANNVDNMKVEATFADQVTKKEVSFDLSFNQQGAPPLLVWGTGVSPEIGSAGPTPFDNYNYYYSFTRLQAAGKLLIGDETFEVTGETWMDHEYGAFPQGTTWILQDAQLDNGIHLSCFASKEPPKQDVAMASQVTVLTADGKSTFHDSVTTPRGPVWTGPEGVSFCTVFEVEIADIDAQLKFTSLMPDQEFRSEFAPVYEGVAAVEGTVAGKGVTGTAWIEQALKAP
jgi:predicted secreted hydrolase